MNDPLPRTISRPIRFENGCAIGISNRWHKGQYCTLLTEAGLVGCGIYDVKTAAEFGQAVAIARGTPQKPLVNPEDLLDAKIGTAYDTLQEIASIELPDGRRLVVAAFSNGWNPDDAPPFDVAPLGTFAEDGPERCSGLPVQRWSAEALAAELGPEFRLIQSLREDHRTPGGAIQPFTWARFERV